MKKGFGIAILVIIGIGILFIGLVYWAFQPEYRTVEIEQNIGGKLICEMEYVSDHHSWDYIIDYSYKPENGDIIFIGNGIYSGREWNEDEQLVKMDKWTVLKTGNRHDSDKIIYGDINTNEWKEYDFTPQTIENDSLWRTKNIKTLINWSPSESFIEDIENNIITVIYEYRIDESNTELTEKKLIEYELSEKPEMKKITNYNNGYK